MRHLHFYLLGVTVLFVACQPVTPTTVNTEAAPTITVAANGQTEIDLFVSTVTKDANSAAGSVTSSASGTDSGSSTNNIKDETAIATILAAPPVQPTPVRPPFRPKTVIGSPSIRLISDLGIANTIRQEGPIEIWQYRFDECVVDFFFYPASQGSSKLIIKNWDMRSAVIGGRVNEGKCLSAMDRHHQKLLARS